MDLRHLKYFLAVAETRNFTQAAASCYVAQSALSQQIARLEKDVGTALFSRTSRAVRLTAAGELLEPLARRILADVDNAQAALDDLAGLRRGRLRLGLVQTLAGAIDMVEVMAEYHALHPGIDWARAHRGRVLHLALVLETVLVLGSYVVAQTAAAPYAGVVRYALIALLGLGLGVQNAASRALAVPDLTTTVLTLTITGIASDSRAAGGNGGKPGRRVLSVAAMFLGALVGAVTVLHGSPALPLLFAAVLLVAATAAAFAMTRSDGSWTAPL
ncbi:LysR family transcriptional regulator [Streptomyces sp. NPDC058251]|uniref:LysR family transcriptional regulator n=1 Tax=Streptomyces sp. NPDC058251 TaxID=3346404 RepID=UPI0036E40ACF